MIDGLPPDGPALVGVLLVGLAVGVLLGLVLGRREAAARVRVEREAGQGGTAPDAGAAEVLEALRSAAVVLTTGGTVVSTSPAAHTLGLVRGDRLVHAAVERLAHDVAADGLVRDEELEVRRSAMGGATLALHVRVARLGDQHVLVLAEDLTEPRRLDAIRRDFVVNTSHELKTPVGALALLAETMVDAADDPEAVRRFAGRMQVEATRLSALVQEIIELSRLQVGDPMRDAAPLAVADVVQEAVDRVRVAAEARGIEVAVGASADATVLGSRELLVTAVRNLLENAVAYSDAGTRVAVGTAVRPGLVEVAVVDQGIGIPAEALPRLFERFYRVDPARSRDTGGTGLGLSIVKHVVAEHGGEVAVWSQPGQGSTFTVRLPLATGTTDEGATR